MSAYTADQTLYPRLMVLSVGTLIAFLLAKKVIITEVVNLFVVFIGVCCLSLCWVTNLSEGVYQILRYVVLLTFMMTLPDVRKYIPWLGLVFAVYGLYQYIQLYQPNSTPLECTGLMSNRNLWASAMVLVLPFCIEQKRWLFSALLVTCICCLFSRTAILALCIIAMVWLGRRSLWLLIPLVIFSFVFKPIEVGEAMDSLFQRMEVWRVSFMIDGPVGIGNWKYVIPKYASNINIEGAFTTLFYCRPHNDFIGMWNELGVGVVFYIGIFVTALYYNRSKLVWSGILAYIVIACFSFPAERTFHSMMLMVYLSMVEREEFKVKFKPVIVILLVVCIFCIAQRVQSGHKEKEIALNSQNYEHVLKTTDNQSWFASCDSKGIPFDFYRGTAFFMVGAKKHALYYFENAYELSPYYIYNLNNLAVCYDFNGMKGKAELFLDKATAIRGDSEAVQRNKDEMDKKTNQVD